MKFKEYNVKKVYRSILKCNCLVGLSILLDILHKYFTTEICAAIKESNLFVTYKRVESYILIYFELSLFLKIFINNEFFLVVIIIKNVSVGQLETCYVHLKKYWGNKHLDLFRIQIISLINSSRPSIFLLLVSWSPWRDLTPFLYGEVFMQ